MPIVGSSANFVFLDLSKVDSGTASSFFLHPPVPFDSLSNRVHWILPLTLAQAFLDDPQTGFSRRLDQGDVLCVANPSGRDWAALFPFEAEAELQAAGPLKDRLGALFLETTTAIPSWLTRSTIPVYVPSADGLWFFKGPQQEFLPWVSPERPREWGAWWIPLGRALLTKLPPLPWKTFPSDGSRKQTPPRPEVWSPEDKGAVAELAARRMVSSSRDAGFLWRPASYPGLGVQGAVDNQESLGGIRKRSLIATMHGYSELHEGRLRVRFREGFFDSLEEASTGQKLIQAGRTFLQWNGRQHSFTLVSSFSFEGDYSWGLRQSLELNHPDLEAPGRAILDYFFVEDSPELMISITVLWPRWKAPALIEAWAPIELTLDALPRSVPWTIQSRWPQGTPHEELVRQARSSVSEGTDFVVACGHRSLALSFAQNQTPRPHRLSWSVVRKWNRRQLILRPEGGLRSGPSSQWDGVEEHFTLILSPGEAARIPFEPTRKQAMELVPPYVEVPKRES